MQFTQVIETRNSAFTDCRPVKLPLESKAPQDVQVTVGKKSEVAALICGKFASFCNAGQAVQVMVGPKVVGLKFRRGKSAMSPKRSQLLQLKVGWK